MDWSDKIRQIENSLGIENERGKLARLLGVRPGLISDIKSGKAKKPGSDIALLLINKLGINPRWLEGGERPLFLEIESYPFFGGPAKKRIENKPTFPLQSEKTGDTIEGTSKKRESSDSTGGEAGKGTMTTLLEKADTTVPRMAGEIPLIYEGDERLRKGIIIPFLGDQAVSAGYGAELEDEDRPTHYFRVPAYLGRYPNLAILPVKGDSMDPTLHDGDMVVCDGGGWDGDGIYVIKTSDEAFVKRVVSTSKGYQVISDNQAYPSYGESKEDVAVVGKVRAAFIAIPGKRGGI